MGQNLVDQWLNITRTSYTINEIIEYTLPIALNARLNTSAPSMATYIVIRNTWSNRGDLRVVQTLNTTAWFNMLILGIL